MDTSARTAVRGGTELELTRTVRSAFAFFFHTKEKVLEFLAELEEARKRAGASIPMTTNPEPTLDLPRLVEVLNRHHITRHGSVSLHGSQPELLEYFPCACWPPGVRYEHVFERWSSS